MSPPKPHRFVDLQLKGAVLELTDIINQINILLPQLSQFIDQFNLIIVNNDINVITDSTGNMSIDAPINMSDEQANDISRRIGIIDRLISTRSQQISDLFDEGSKIKDSSDKSSEYNSIILDKLAEYNKLKNSYKH
jgi:hypothetical protein